MTLHNLKDPEVIRRMDNLRVDNTGVVKRPGAREIEMKVLPVLRKAFRTTKTLPQELIATETKFLERVLWPRSLYRFENLLAQTKPYESVDSAKCDYVKLIDQFTHCWSASTRFELDLKLPRNNRALKKAAGLPKFGKKGDQIGAAKQYYSEVMLSNLSPEGVDKTWWSVMPGTRTQQSDPEHPEKWKSRLVWSIPVSVWVGECILLDSAITNAITACKTLNKEIQIFYTDPIEQKKWMAKYASQVTQWVSLDSSQYDSHVQAPEQDVCWQYFASGNEAHLAHSYYCSYSNVIMPGAKPGTAVAIVRTGGEPSGSKGTNLFDGFTNVGDLLEVFDRLGLLRYVVCIMVNGDDITIGFSTRLIAKNLKDISKFSRREISADKSEVFAEHIWNSKWFIHPDHMYRPIFRAANSLMFKERQSDPITGSSGYVAVARAQIMKDVEEHPLYDVFEREVLRYEERPLSSFTDKEILPAVEAYVADHDYLGTQDSQSVLKELRRTSYGSH